MAQPHSLSPPEWVLRSLKLSLLLLAWSLLFLPGVALAQLSQTGRWTPYSDWSGSEFQKKYAVHMILLRADGNPYHSRIFWFRGQTLGSFRGAEWGWTPPTDGCENWPTANFRAISVDTTEADFFCTGHATLADGRLLLVGGSHAVTGNYGENKSRIFTPGPDSSKSTWSAPDTLRARGGRRRPRAPAIEGRRRGLGDRGDHRASRIGCPARRLRAAHAGSASLPRELRAAGDRSQLAERRGSTGPCQRRTLECRDPHDRRVGRERNRLPHARAVA